MVFGHFGQELQNSPKLTHLHVGLYHDANEKSKPRKGLLVKLNHGIKMMSVFFNSVCLFLFVNVLIVI